MTASILFFAMLDPSTVDWLGWWMISALAISGFALFLGLRNLAAFETAPEASPAGDEGWSVTVCIPARDEADNIEACVRSILAAGDADPISQTTVMVYDDGSTDGTSDILARLVEEDDRVVAASVRDLPDGWNGKQHGCDAIGPRGCFRLASLHRCGRSIHSRLSETNSRRGACPTRRHRRAGAALRISSRTDRFGR